MERGIDPERLRTMVEAGASLKELCVALEHSPAAVRNGLQQLGLQTLRMERAEQFSLARQRGEDRVEARCRKHGLTTFFRRTDGAFQCVRCNSVAVAKRRRKVKQILVEEAGGACASCGYDRYIGALQFHHFNRADKEFGLSRHGVTRSLREARSEAAKCVLLCANCHSEVEGGFTLIPAKAR